MSGATDESLSKEATSNDEEEVISEMLSQQKIEDISTNEIDVSACANCGKEGDEESMNTCNKCNMAKYCNATCKKKHKSKHKKKCERRIAELYDENLFKDHPPREECPICMITLPIDSDQTEFKSCCDKIICLGCFCAMVEEGIERGKTKEEVGMCAFCREPNAYSSNEEEVERLKRQMEKGNAKACNTLGSYYGEGIMGMPRDQAKANELFLKAGQLGCADGYSNLGCSYYVGRGVETDKEKAKHYTELAAMNGSVGARHKIGLMEGVAGNYQRAYKHLMIAARVGDRKSLERVKKGFTNGYVTKDEYESTLRACHERQLEMKSEVRDAAAASSPTRSTY